MNKILTLSVAAYNVENYIEKLLSSVANSAVINDLEVLVINDGSNDGTVKKAEKFVEKHPDSIKVINKNNGGMGSAINRGIYEATGRFFKSIDGDDWVDTASLISVIQRLKVEQSDMVLTGYKECYENGVIKDVLYSQFDNNRVYDADTFYNNINYLPYHGVIYKTSILKNHNIVIDEHSFYVDVEYVTFPIPWINTVAYYSAPFYCYRLGREGQSVSLAGRVKHVNDYLIVGKSLINFYIELEKISDIKKSTACKAASYACSSYIAAALLLKPSSDVKKKIINFEQYIKMTSEEIYIGMENIMDKSGNKVIINSKIIKLLRNTNYMLYKIFSMIKRLIFKIQMKQ